MVKYSYRFKFKKGVKNFMKKLLAAMMIAVFAITLSACGGGEITDDIVDCVQNPDDPECQQTIDCLQNPDDPACEIDCAVTPDDPSCQVDCAVTPDDPACELECPEGQEEFNGTCVVIDGRTPSEIAAQLVYDNWDGTMDHVGNMMEHMDFDEASTTIFELNFDVTDGEENVVINLVIQDEVEHGMYDVVRRTVSGTIDEEEFEFILIMEETETGFILYYDTSFLRTIIADEAAIEVQEVLDTLDANGTWFMFKFDDSLENLVEFEVLKEMAILALYQELGDDILTVIEDEIDFALGLNLVLYGFDFSEFVEYLFDDDFEAAQLMLDDVDFDQLIFDLDQMHLVPEIINHLTMYDADMVLVDPTWDLAVESAYLLANGTEAWLMQLTEQDIQNILTVHDPMLGEVYGAYLDDDLDHYIIMQLLNDPEVQMELANIPGLDVPGFVMTMDNLDYDAFNMEYVDMEALFQAVYEGYAAYDLFVGELNATAPQTASILAHFGGMGGAVDAIQEYMIYVDEVELGVTNLDMFADYIDPDYYLGIDLLDIELELTEEFQVVTTGTVQLGATSQLFQDFTADLYWYLDAFETFDMPYVDVLNCPALQECDTWEDYPEIISTLEQIGDIVLTVEYDPLNMDETVIMIQFADLAQSLIDMDEFETAVVNDMSITITMLTSAIVDVPATDISDVNQMAEDFARFSLIMEARNYLENIEYYYSMFPMEIPAVPVNTPISTISQYAGVSVAFDEELSYYRITGNAIDGYEYSIQLFWLDGTPVFTEPLFFSDLEMQFGSGTGAPSRTEFVYWMDKVVPENFNMTKLFLVYMWERDVDYIALPLF